MVTYQAEFAIGEEVWKVVLELDPETHKTFYCAVPARVSAVTFGKRKVSYKCTIPWQLKGLGTAEPVFKTKADAQLFAGKKNEALKESRKAVEKQR